MWGLLAVSVVILLLFMYAPGYLIFRGFGRRRSVSLACAPLFSIVGYSILAVVYARVGIACSWVVLFFPLLLFGAVLAALRIMRVRKRISARTPNSKSGAARSVAASQGAAGLRGSLKHWIRQGSVRTFMAYLVAGLCGALLLYIAPLGSADAFVCGWDYVHHVSVTRSFVDSGNWSMLEVTIFPGQDGAFYPSAYSLMGALLLSCLNAPATLALNAVNITIVGFIYPLGMWMFMAYVFGWRDSRTYAGAACCLLFLAFPWLLFTRSAPTLYAFLLGVAVLPGFLVLLMDCFGAKPDGLGLIRECESIRNPQSAIRKQAVFKLIGGLAIALLALMGVASAHPSAAFSGVLFAIAYIAYVLVVRTRGLHPAVRVLCVVLWLAACAAVWFALSHASFVQSIVNYSYSLKKGPVLSAALVLVFWARHLGAQFVLGFLGAVGILACFMDKHRRWVLLPYFCFAAFAYVCIAIPMCDLRIALTGFWYNHSVRLFAALVICGVPLVAQGAGVFMNIAALIVRALARRIPADDNSVSEQRLAKLRDRLLPIKMTTGWAGALVMAIIVLMVAFLPLPIPKAYTLLQYEQKMAYQNDPNSDASFLSEDERAFCQRAAEVCSGGGTVLNVPNDGSGFAYGLYDMNTLERDWYGVDDGTDIALVASQIDEIASDGAVSAAAERLGIEYVLRLDDSERENATIYQSAYHPEEWVGIFAIRDDTPGFEVVMAEDDMRLYRISLDG